MIGRIRNSLAAVNYGHLAVELLVLVIGILIAFQIDRWAEGRRDRELEHDYLLRLQDDLHIEIQSIDRARSYAAARIAAILLLEESNTDPAIAVDRPGEVAAALETATWRSFPQIDAFVYSELQSTGNLALIRSVSLRRDLANHYSTLRHYAQVGLDLDLQHQFDRLTAGILTTTELQNIELDSWNEIGNVVSAERAQQIVRELQNRQGAMNLLPNLAQHHYFNQKVMESARNRTLALIELVETLIEGTEL